MYYTCQVRVLITGGAGFIGSHLCDAFVLQNDEVTILDNLSTGTKKNIDHVKDKIKIITGDIRDKELVEDLVSRNDLILHMAAAVGVNNILNNPIDSISINYHGSEIVLNSSAKFDKRIIIASTSEVYGKNPNQPLSESDDRIVGTPQKLRWSYSDAKALEEAYAHALFLTQKLRVTTIRLFNTVGPRQTGKYGMVIPRFVNSAVSNEPITIFGDGTQTRVFCHIKDTVKAIIALSKMDKSIGEVFNIGGQGEISILNLAKLVIKVAHSDSSISFLDYDRAYPVGFEDMKKRMPDISKIHKFTGWMPENDIRKIIEDVVISESYKVFGQP
jgi:UDP-glucose 4-epimerase